MARLSDQFVRAARSPNKTRPLYQMCLDAGMSSTHFSLYMPRRKAKRQPGSKQHGPIGVAPKKVPAARWSKVRAKILMVAKELGVPASRVFVEDDE